MGGSRCSYRNCTMRSGTNNIHMFHYPVYDKKRCHQWLANAEKFEFLNLKLSQLRNRIVCQFHFKDECFMNYLKDKLTFDAIPTVDGPFCDATTANTDAQEAANVFSLVLNDGESIDKYIKKNTSSVIYADFLTNGDAWEKQSLNETIWNNKVVSNASSAEKKVNKIIDVPASKDSLAESSLITLPNITDAGIITKIIDLENAIPDMIYNTRNENNSDQNQNVTFLDKREKKQKKISTENRISNKEFNSLIASQEVVNSFAKQDSNELLLNQENNNVIANINNNMNTSSNIVIDQITSLKWPDKQNATMITERIKKKMLQSSENQYSETSPNRDNIVMLKCPQELPIHVDTTYGYELNKEYKDNFIPVQQMNTNCLEKSDESTKPKIKILSERRIRSPITITNKKHRPLILNSTGKRKAGVIPIDEDIKSSIPITQNNDSDIKPPEIVPKNSTFKHKISPERVAAIQKKRNFNKRLRDIIEICLEKLDEPDKTIENNAVANSSKEKEPKEKINSLKQNIGSYLSKQADLPNAHEYTMKFMEAKMNNMQDILLNKIEQNTQRIVELKKSIAPKGHSLKTVATQTPLNEESYKKQLYQEISKFLSPDANSLVYEELFINKYGQKITHQPSPKRRKRR